MQEELEFWVKVLSEIDSAKEFLKETPKYSGVKVENIAHIFKYDAGKEKAIRIDFLNFIIQKLKCS